MGPASNAGKAAVFRWEMWGIPFIAVLGALLHFTFEWSGGWRPAGVISAVNESVWEHLKLTFWPTVFWTVIEYLTIYRKVWSSYPGFLLARAIGAFSMPVVIVVVFYSYTAFTGDNILAVDLSSFVIAVVLGQAVSYRLWVCCTLSPAYNRLGLGLFIIGILALAVFTFYPPHVGIFRDWVTGGYGITGA